MHKDDIDSVLATLPRITDSSIYNMVFRLKHHNSSFSYVEAQGRLHSDQTKGKKVTFVYASRSFASATIYSLDEQAILFTLRERPTPKLALGSVYKSGGFGQVEYWSKLSENGLCLHATSAVEQVTGFRPSDIIGLSLFQLSKAEFATELKQALLKAREGSVTGVRYKLKSRKHGWVDAFSTFYPATSSCPDDEDGQSGNCTYAPSTLPNRAPFTSILCQTNTFESELRRQGQKGRQTQNSTSTQAGVGPVATSGNLFKDLECDASNNWQ